jgi:dihydropteroate synthase
MTSRLWRFAGDAFTFGPLPKLMGIVNVTPDSFSDGGRFIDVDRAVEHALQLVEQGADILDVGGESTRPGAEPVSAHEELRRVIPVIERLAGQVRVPMSIDTMKADVAEEALQAGATVINDVSGLEFDSRMIDVAAAGDSGVIVMHMRGTPQTMQDNPVYADVVSEVRDYLAGRLAVLKSAGIAAERVLLDPGIGFGKTAEHNVQLLSNIAALHQLGRPVLVGHSRKRFLKKLLGREVEERTSGTIGVSIALAQQGVEILRVHEPQPVRDALLAWSTVRGG